jgi:hypothetical protein
MKNRLVVFSILCVVLIYVVLNTTNGIPSKKVALEETQVPLNTPANSLLRLPVISIDRVGDLGGKFISDIVRPQDVNRVIILKNATSAPEMMHLGSIDRIFTKNPKIQSFFYIDPNNGHLTRSYKSEINGFFTALLLTDKGNCIGFDISREKVRVFNSEGDGWMDR